MHKARRYWRTLTTITFLTVCITVIAACGGKVRELTWDDNGRRIETAVGQSVVVTLESDPSSGSAWVIEPLDEEALEPVTVGAYIPGENGGVGSQEFAFEAKIGRDVNLRIAYKPVSEPDAQATKTFAVEVAIR